MDAPTAWTRRGLLAGACALGGAALSRQSWAASAGLPPGGVLSFEIHGKGTRLGRHRVTFSREGLDLSVQTQVEITFKFGPVPLVQYSHHAVEVWRADRFDRLETTSVTNGRKQAVRAHRTDSGVLIEPAEGAPYLADGGVLPLTHWNRTIMDGPLFNPQDGKLLRERAIARGVDTVQMASGRALQATRYSLAGETQIDDWYDHEGVWAALRARIKDGSILTYRRTDA